MLAGTVGTAAEPRVRTLSAFTAADIAWVPQHPVMVAATVLEEIRLYANGWVGGRVAGDCPRVPGRGAAGHLAGHHPAELSPGELRRVALARGLARIEAGATVLLLDEPTAHLDRASADAGQRAIPALRGQVTVLLVAHDRQTRDLADHLVPVSARGARHGPATTAMPGGGGPAASLATQQAAREISRLPEPPARARPCPGG